jgi:hypothetical protein
MYLYVQSTEMLGAIHNFLLQYDIYDFFEECDSAGVATGVEMLVNAKPTNQEVFMSFTDWLKLCGKFLSFLCS